MKRCRSEGSILDPTENLTCKSIGGSDGNLSQCSIQSSKTRKSNEIVIEESVSVNTDFSDGVACSLTEEEIKLNRDIGLSRHNR